MKQSTLCLSDNSGTLRVCAQKLSQDRATGGNIFQLRDVQNPDILREPDQNIVSEHRHQHYPRTTHSALRKSKHGS
jgi:hypothetical protein